MIHHTKIRLAIIVYILSALLTLALFWIAGQDFNTREPATAFAIFISLAFGGIGLSFGGAAGLYEKDIK